MSNKVPLQNCVACTARATLLRALSLPACEQCSVTVFAAAPPSASLPPLSTLTVSARPNSPPAPRVNRTRHGLSNMAQTRGRSLVSPVPLARAGEIDSGSRIQGVCPHVQYRPQSASRKTVAISERPTLQKGVAPLGYGASFNRGPAPTAGDGASLRALHDTRQLSTFRCSAC